MTASGKHIVILGATSAIAVACARLWAEQGARFSLVARDPVRADAVAGDLMTRGAANVNLVTLDCAQPDAADELDRIVTQLGRLDIMLLAYGALGNQRECENDPAAAANLIRTNFESAALWCLAGAKILEKQRSGILVVIGSVAGDRGRQSNYLYGATKGGLAILVEGIAHRLARVGARAIVVKPGLVDTPMTARIDKKGPLWAKPMDVAAIIVRSAEKGGPVVYAPSFWIAIMAIVRILPWAVFRKTRL
jgi:short-subunit dehydrogenase